MVMYTGHSCTYHNWNTYGHKEDDVMIMNDIENVKQKSVWHATVVRNNEVSDDYNGS